MDRDGWRTSDTDALFDAVLRLRTTDEAAAFFRDLCTLGELHDLANRWAVVRLLDEGLHYAEIALRTGASTATITRIAQWLRHGEGGYQLLLERTRGDSEREANAGGERRGDRLGDRGADGSVPYPVGRER